MVAKKTDDVTVSMIDTFREFKETQEYLALNTEGYVIVAERLVFCDAMQRQRKVSHLLT